MSQSDDNCLLGELDLVSQRQHLSDCAEQDEGLNRWLCVNCHQTVAREQERAWVQGASEHSFVNPSGIKFEILLFEKAHGCLNVGMPTLEHTWFPGCAWSYCVCGRCRSHLGWFYTGARAFVAMIRGRIVRAVLAHN